MTPSGEFKINEGTRFLFFGYDTNMDKRNVARERERDGLIS